MLRRYPRGTGVSIQGRSAVEGASPWKAPRGRLVAAQSMARHCADSRPSGDSAPGQLGGRDEELGPDSSTIWGDLLDQLPRMTRTRVRPGRPGARGGRAGQAHRGVPSPAASPSSTTSPDPRRRRTPTHRPAVLCCGRAAHRLAGPRTEPAAPRPYAGAVLMDAPETGPASRLDPGSLVIDRIETIALRAPLGRRFSGSAYSMDNRCTIVVRLTTADGVTAETYSGDTDDEQALIVGIIHDELAPAILGRSARDPEGRWRDMEPATNNILRDRGPRAPGDRRAGHRDLGRARPGRRPAALPAVGCRHRRGADLDHRRLLPPGRGADRRDGAALRGRRASAA